ncbi:hypothetical protein LTR06_009425 [Exophiala xenobiotica]|nr:hypothetical protein LTR06_009425 [Exophiala xenobiotica]
MTSSVSIHVENRQSGKNANGSVPVNGQKQTFGALYGTSVGGTAQGLEIVVSDEHGNQKAVLDDNGTPFVIGSQAVDITDWYITAQKQ